MTQKNSLLVLKGLKNNVKECISFAQMEQTLRIVCMFDPYFRWREPNLVKRRRKLRRILNFDVRLSDFEWVKEMYKVVQTMKKHNIKQSLKHSK